VDKYTNIAHFRIDKIKKIEICDNPAKPIRQVEGFEHGFRLSEYMKEHIYMFGGETVHARLKVDTYLIGQMIDWFGKEFTVVSDDGTKCEIRLTVNENALFYWAMQYGQHVEVMSPTHIRDWIRKAVGEMIEKYKEE